MLARLSQLHAAQCLLHCVRLPCCCRESCGCDALRHSCTVALPPLRSFAHDDRLLEDTWGVAYNDVILGSGVRNPNGCRPPITW
jgi:hypothetical protein